LNENHDFRADKDISFWEGVDRCELLLKKCGNCNTILAPGTKFCPECWSHELGEVKASGRGTVYSFLIFHRAFSENETPPYGIAMISLEEGVRIISRVKECGILNIGDAVEATWSNLPEQGPVLEFTQVTDQVRISR